MSAKATLYASTTAGGLMSAGRIGPGGRPIQQLSDGTAIAVVGDTTHAYLAYSSDRVTWTTLYTFGSTASGSFCLDSSDNIYVYDPGSTTLRCLLKGAGLSWTAKTGTSAGIWTNFPSGSGGLIVTQLTWCNTGGGTSSKGHVLAVGSNSSTSNQPAMVFDAGALQAGTATTFVNNYTTAWNFAINLFVQDLAANGTYNGTLGGTSGLVCHSGSGTVYVGSWSVSSSGVLTAATVNSETYINPTTDRVRLLNVGSGVWALVHNSAVSTGLATISRWSSTARLTAAVDRTAATGWPDNTNTANWDATYDTISGKVWVYGQSSTTACTILRLGCAVGAGAVWDTGGATVDDTGVGSGGDTLIRVCVSPVNLTRVDWYTYNTNGSTFSLLTDYTPYNAVPLAPTLTAPTPGLYADLALGYTFSWTYNPANTLNTELDWALRRKVSGAASYEYWNVSSGAWQSTIVWNAGSATSYTFGASLWVDGNAYVWSVATQDSGGQGPFASDSTVNAQANPSVTVTQPNGTSITSQPTATWTPSVAGGASQTAYRVVVYSSTQYAAPGFTPGASASAWDSGVVASAATQALIGTALTNGTAYRAYVQITESGGQTSAWAFSAFTVSLDAPAQPSITAVYSSASNLVLLAVQAGDNLLSGNQASMETDATGWAVVSNCTLARSTAQALDGVASLSLTSVAAGAMSAETTPTVAVTALTAYTALASLRAAATPRSCTAQIAWFKGDGSANGVSAAGGAVNTTTSGWTLAACVATAPANTAFAAVVVNVAGTAAAGELTYVDEVALFTGSVAAQPWTRGGLVGSTTVLIERSRDGGVTWTAVRNGSGVPVPAAAQQVSLNDYEALPGDVYRATVSANV